jgi:hypothetical protein
MAIEAARRAQKGEVSRPTIYKITKADMDKLTYFEYDIDGYTFIKEFVSCGGTQNMAEHLWEKFHTLYNHSILRLWGNLDSNNQTIVLTMINRWKGR